MLKINEYVVVRFKTKKKVIHNIGQIMSEDGELFIKFLKAGRHHLILFVQMMNYSNLKEMALFVDFQTQFSMVGLLEPAVTWSLQ